MLTSLSLLSSQDLLQIAAALQSGRLVPPFSPILLRRYVPESLATRIAEELGLCANAGMEPTHLADWIEVLYHDRSQRPLAEDLIDLVWTGPEAPGIVNRETSVVVREMFQEARASVLVAGYAVYQGHTVFKELADRMDERPSLNVRMFLDIQRPPGDASSPSELVRVFGQRFIQKEWPGKRVPALYYDPRSLAVDRARRASLHAKCVVVDNEQAFVSSANFTEAAQTKNIEVGVHLRCSSFARRLSEHFEALAALHVLQPIPIRSRSSTRET